LLSTTTLLEFRLFKALELGKDEIGQVILFRFRLAEISLRTFQSLAQHLPHLKTHFAAAGRHRNPF